MRIAMMVIRLIWKVPYYLLGIWWCGKSSKISFEESFQFVKKVTKTIEDINNGFKGAYVTLELDLTDVAEGALVFESCKCCTTILDLWIE